MGEEAPFPPPPPPTPSFPPSAAPGTAPRPRRLRCAVQNYDWGRVGAASTVARLAASNSGAAEVDDRRPYAEFWMGTHPSGPSYLDDDGAATDSVWKLRNAKPKTLRDWIRGNPKVLGERVAQRWGSELPFLFKILSVNKALSIQAHPDKALAEFLHQEYPAIYKDANHKPEMAVALTQFRALCGFVSLQELKTVFVNVPEVVDMIGDQDAEEIFSISQQEDEDMVKGILRSIFTKVMAASQDVISESVSKLIRRLKAEKEVRTLTEKEWLALELEKQYPNDIGVISSFFFNYVKLEAGEALYLGPNEPHAYLSGECIECMATSDNVVRAGLTPKFRDVQTLCSMLTYKQGYPEILCGIRLNRYITRYTPPYDEFEVDSCSLPSGEHVVYPAVPGPSLFVVLVGEGDLQIGCSDFKEDIKEGDVLFVPASTQISLTAGALGALRLYRAGINGRFFSINDCRF